MAETYESKLKSVSNMEGKMIRAMIKRKDYLPSIVNSLSLIMNFGNSLCKLSPSSIKMPIATR